MKINTGKIVNPKVNSSTEKFQGETNKLLVSKSGIKNNFTNPPQSQKIIKIDMIHVSFRNIF